MRSRLDVEETKCSNWAPDVVHARSTTGYGENLSNVELRRVQHHDDHSALTNRTRSMKNIGDSDGACLDATLKNTQGGLERFLNEKIEKIGSVSQAVLGTNLRDALDRFGDLRVCRSIT